MQCSTYLFHSYSDPDVISSLPKWPAVQDLGHMNKFDVQASPARDPLLMHEAGHIRRSNVLRPVAEMIADLFHPHARGHGRVCHAERAAETAAIVRPVKGHQDEPLHLFEQVGGLVERRSHDL